MINKFPAKLVRKLRLGTKQECLPTAPDQFITGCSSHYSKAKKKKKFKKAILKGRDKTVSIFRWYNYVHRKFQRMYKIIIYKILFKLSKDNNSPHIDL